MAVYDGAYQDPVPEAQAVPGGGFAKFINIAGGLTSLALVVGIGVWGYKLMVRDVSGVPVVRALEGPMRVQPDDPGGRPADHQGLSVNDVAAHGAAAPAADRLVLAPRPVGLTEEDKPAAALAVAEDAAERPGDPQVQALVDQLIAGVKPLDAPEPAPETVPETVPVPVAARAADIVQPEPLAPVTAETLAEPQPAVFTGPGLARSLRPQLRPSGVVRARAEAGAQAPVAASGVQDIDPASLPVGTRLAQLGAFDSAETARREWDRLDGRFGDYMDGKARVVQEASSGGRAFFRLRAMGFDDIHDARRFCAVLTAEGVDCIPVTVR